MQYAVDKSERYTTLSLQEEKLDTLVAPKLKTEFVTMFQAGTSNLILDMSKVKYVDSSGLSAILVANRLAGEAKGYMVMIGVQDHVMKLINISKLDQVLTILKSKEEAIDAIFLNEIEKDLNTEDEE